MHMKNSVHASCPNCKTLLTFTRHFLGMWSKVQCPSCRSVIRPEDVRQTLIHCHSCNRDIAVDIFRSDVNTCPICCGKIGLPSPAVLISNKDMPAGALLWTYPDEYPSSDSELSLQPGTAALIVNGDECVLVQSKSGKLQFASDGTPFRIVFLRTRLACKLLWGMGAIELHDRHFRINDPKNLTCSHGYLDLEIEDPIRFARKLQYRPCTERQVGLEDPFGKEFSAPGADFPQIVIPHKRFMEQACRQVIERHDCLMSDLAEHPDEICEAFRVLSSDFLMREWGLKAVGCTVMHYPQITREVLEDRYGIFTMLTSAIDWHTEPFEIHLKDKPSYRSAVEVRGTMLLNIVDENLLMNCPEYRTWMLSADKNLPAQTISTFLGKQIHSLLIQAFQDKMNIYDRMIPEMIDTYLDHIARELTDFINGDIEFIADRGLEVRELKLRFHVLHENDLMRKWIEMQNLRDMNTMQRTIDDIMREERIHEAEENIREQLRVYQARAKADEERAQADESYASARHLRRMNALIRESEIQQLDSNLVHDLDMRQVRQEAELHEIQDRSRTASVSRSLDTDHIIGDARRSEERADQSNRETLFRSEHGIRAAQDAYAREKMIADARAQAQAESNSSKRR